MNIKILIFSILLSSFYCSSSENDFNGIMVTRHDKSLFFIRKIFIESDRNQCESGTFVAFQKCEMSKGGQVSSCEYFNHEKVKEVLTHNPSGFKNRQIKVKLSQAPHFYCTSKLIESDWKNELHEHYKHQKTVGKVLKGTTLAGDLYAGALMGSGLAGLTKNALLASTNKIARFLVKGYKGYLLLSPGAIVIGSVFLIENEIFNLDSILRQSFIFRNGFRIADYSILGEVIFNDKFIDPKNSLHLTTADYSNQYIEKQLYDDFSNLITLSQLSERDNDDHFVYSFWDEVEVDSNFNDFGDYLPTFYN